MARSRGRVPVEAQLKYMEQVGGLLAQQTCGVSAPCCIMLCAFLVVLLVASEYFCSEHGGGLVSWQREGWLTDDGLQVGLQVAIARCCRHRRTRFCFGGYGSVDALPIGEGREGGKERMGPPAFAPRPSYPWSPAPRSSPPRSSAAPWSPSAATVHTRGSSIACGQCFCTACARALHMRRGCTVCARALCVMTVC